MWEAHDALIVEFRDQVGYGVDGEAWINEDADKLGVDSDAKRNAIKQT